MEELVSSTSFWQGRRVFLTGHTGFKGSWLSVILAGLGAEVHGYALDPLPDSIYSRAGVGTLLKSSTIADIREGDELRRALLRSEPDIVLHLAAQPLVRLSYRIPVDTFAVNVMGTVNLLEAVRACPQVKGCVVVTSDKCYENREWVWSYRENEAMGGFDPYSASKGCTELVTSAYRRSFFAGAGGIPLASGRAGNVIGGGDVSQDRLVPDLVKAFRAGQVPVIRNPDAVRPWQHVIEPLSGYLLLAERLCSSGGASLADGWNFGPDSSAERTVGEVVEAASRLWGQGATWRQDSADHPHEAGYLKLDSSKARRCLGWAPVWRFEEAVRATIDWYRAEEGGRNMLAFTEQQIQAYASASPLHERSP